MAAPPTINKFHNLLLDRIIDTLSPSLKTVVRSPSLRIEPDLKAWENLSTKLRTFRFSMLLEEYYETTVNDLNRDVRLIPLRTYKNGFSSWCSWSEEWICLDKREFDLVGAGWTFFWGRTPRATVQICRAEWDQITRRGEYAGQPHWHVDPPLPTEGIVISLDDIDEAGALQELGSEPNLLELGSTSAGRVQATVKQSGIHFGMAGWENAPVKLECKVVNKSAITNCWQRDMTKDFGRVIPWASEAVLYMKRELMHLEPVIV